MKEWVQIAFDHKDKWKYFATISADNVRQLKSKSSTKKNSSMTNKARAQKKVLLQVGDSNWNNQFKIAFCK